MSELELLFLVLALVYAWECALWVPRGSLAFRTWLGRNWGLSHPDVLFGNQKGGFIWAQPLPPLGTVLTTNQFPLALSPDGVLSLVSPYLDSRSDPARSSRFFRFNDIRTVEVRGKKVLVNGQLLLGAPSSGLAEYVSRQIRRIQQTPAGSASKRSRK